MKTSTILSILLLACAGCDQPKQATLKNSYTAVTDSAGRPRFTVDVLNVYGHEYVVAQRGGLSIIHAAHCPCQGQPVKVVQGYQTNFYKALPEDAKP